MATQGRRRALGQHFLRDQTVTHAIAEAAIEEISRHGCVSLLEIGPGKGAITHPILDRLSQVPLLQNFVLVERDRKLAASWSEETQSKNYPFRVSVEDADFLDIPEDRWMRPAPLGVVSNLPYSAGTAIVTRLAKHRAEIPVMVLMFQSEVAKRLRAEPSTKDRGSLSIWIQNWWDVRKLLFVPPRAFSPPPEVDSEVVVLTRRKAPWIAVDSHPKAEALFENLLKACFAHRRKMLRSILPWQNALELADVDGTKRAEALGWSEWDRLYQAVKKISSL